MLAIGMCCLTARSCARCFGGDPRMGRSAPPMSTTMSECLKEGEQFRAFDGVAELCSSKHRDLQAMPIHPRLAYCAQIYNHMVMDSHELDLVFGALADPIRRGILASLSSGEQNVSQLTKPFGVSQPAISRHIRTLHAAGLIQKEKRGREQFVRVNSSRAEQAAVWIMHYSKFWRAHFDEVERILNQSKGQSDDD